MCKKISTHAKTFLFERVFINIMAKIVFLWQTLLFEPNFTPRFMRRLKCQIINSKFLPVWQKRHDVVQNSMGCIVCLFAFYNSQYTCSPPPSHVVASFSIGNVFYYQLWHQKTITCQIVWRLVQKESLPLWNCFHLSGKLFLQAEYFTSVRKIFIIWREVFPDAEWFMPSRRCFCMSEKICGQKY